MVATAPLFSRGSLIGLLSIGAHGDAEGMSARQSRLLASAIDYASILEAVAGPSMAGRRAVGAERSRLEEMLRAGRFHIVFQPIVILESGATVGYEALTRFDDGMPPDEQFADAAAAGLGPPFELAAISQALDASGRLAAHAFLSLNVSPDTLLTATQELGRLIRDGTGRSSSN